MKLKVRHKLILLSFIILGGTGFIGYAVYISNQKMQASMVLVQHTEEVISQSGNVLSLAKDVETASRGFVITHDSVFIEPLLNAEEKTNLYISQLRKLTQDNSSQDQRVDSLEYYMHKRLDYSLQTVELRSKEGLASAIAYVSTKQGKYYTDRMRAITEDIQNEEATLLKHRKQMNDSRALAFNRFSAIVFILVSAFNVFLLIMIGNNLVQSEERNKRAAELVIANKELVFQSEEKEKRAAELVIADKELAYQHEEKDKRAAELIIANKELAFQTGEKGKRAAELVVANKELAFQSEEKHKRAAELIIADKALVFQTEEKKKRAAELFIADKELVFQNEEKDKRAAELVIADKELIFQNKEKVKRAEELVIADKELIFQTEEKGKRAEELIIANVELIFQNKEKEKRAEELVIANKELVIQNREKEKRAEELIVAYKELIFQNEEKEKRAEELVIANKELVFQNEEKEKRAEELLLANKELESFSYSVSHDLRSPLRAVHGYARILKEDYGTTLAAEPNRVMDNIMSNAKRMGQLLDDLLTFSRLGRKELVTLNIPMQDMVTNLCHEIKGEKLHNHVQFIIDDLESAQGDSVVIKQVWVNLISNAVKYSALNKKPIIKISSEVKENEIVYSIKDNGVGFDMIYANKLFGLFQRLHTDEQFEGTGVGLAIVHRIISKHDGRVWAEAKLDEGATFHFTLPRQQH